jgi:hypothetical protein
MVSVKQNPIGMDGKGSKPTTVKEAQANAKLLYDQVMSALDATNALLDRTPLNDKKTRMKLERAKRELLDRYDKASRKLVGSYENPNGGGLSQHIDAAFDAAASGDRGGLTTTKAAIRKALNSAKQPEGQKAREYIFGVLDIIVKNRGKWSGARTEKAVREYSAAVYDRVLPKLNIKQNGGSYNGVQLKDSATVKTITVDGVTVEVKKARFGKGQSIFWGIFKPKTNEKLSGLGYHTLTDAKDGLRLLIDQYGKDEVLTALGQSKNHTATDLSKNPARYKIEFSSDGRQWIADQNFDNKADAAAEIARQKKIDNSIFWRIVEVDKYGIRSKNHTANDFHAFKENKSKEHFKMFQGKQPSGAVRVLQPDSAPKETSRLGDLVLMKVIKSNGSKQNINFDGEAFLAIDLRKNLWAIGKDARIANIALPRKGELKYLGKLKQIDYVTAKKHIGGNKLTRFWHELGEVDKNYPSLYVDADGFPIIHGGGYDVWNIGIVN